MSKGRIAIVGAGPGGMATALAAHRAGFEASIYERYPEVKPAGNILNLWPPPQKVLGLIGVDTTDLGAAALTTFRRSDGHLRATVRLPDEVVAEYGGGFIGLLRWGLYKRMLDALPPGVLKLGHEMTRFEDGGDRVVVHLADREPVEADVLVGGDGLRSAVRRQLWGDSPIRHQHLHLVGGYLYVDDPERPPDSVIAHDRSTQASYTPILHEGQWGYEWWVLEAFDPSEPFDQDLMAFSRTRAAGFSEKLRSMIDATPSENLQRWEIRDRKPLKQWSKGRVTLVGDAAHPTSPYAAYGAGMSIEDGYFLASELERIDVRDLGSVRRALQAFEDRRKPHTRRVSQQAFFTGYAFHRIPHPLRPLRDLVYDHTPMLQKVVGDATPDHILSQLAEIDQVEAARPVSSAAVTPQA
ncbi:6-hydroxynicotinate 3-monooxygenase [Baekduia alba]|uniref:FAD-dependent oxidoreductase n=1 Tax=Baekduia alba TaxID=2997333 RepID=UPI002341A07B|nr:NAD(P)/FAD-dependent oxidoreductase [Baekduia alba]WCB93289.1 6-hydroxynicotinate 3-monooxygenase [Baekduia alba]